MLTKSQPALRNSIRISHSLKESHPKLYFPPSIYSAPDRESIYSGAPTITGASELEFTFDDDVVNSKVYRRVLAEARTNSPALPQKHDPHQSTAQPQDTSKTGKVNDTVASNAVSSVDDRSKPPRPKNTSGNALQAKEILVMSKHRHRAFQTLMKIDRMVLPNLVDLSYPSAVSIEVVWGVSNVCNYIFHNPIGQATHSNVWLASKVIWVPKATANNKNPYFAVKQMVRGQISSEQCNRLLDICNEISILKTLIHPKIIVFQELLTTSTSIAMVFDFVEGESLYALMRKSKLLANEDIKKYFGQLLSALKWIHSKGVVHRRITLANILVQGNHNIVVAGFGQARRIVQQEVLPASDEQHYYGLSLKEKSHPDKPLIYKLGNADLLEADYRCPSYGAPEIIVSSIYGGRKADLWSCGIILVRSIHITL